MIISIPTKAKENYIALCKAHDKEKDITKKRDIEKQANGYFSAISDICGPNVAGHIGMEADLSFSDDAPRCVGIKMDV